MSLRINKLVAIGSITTGLLFLLMGGIFAYMLFQMNKLIISAATMFPGGEAIAGMMSPFLIIGWIFTALSLISGIISLITGIMYFMQKQ